MTPPPTPPLADLGRKWPLQGPESSKILPPTPCGVVLLADRGGDATGGSAPGALVRVVVGAVAGGVRWVVLREKDLPRAERAALAAHLRPILAEAGGTLVVAGPDPLGGDAVHLPAAGPYPPPRPGPAGRPRPWLVGRSCHDAAELARLTTEDYATLSPVYPSRSKPGYGPPLGPRRLGELIRFSPVPVLALGGIETPEQVRACLAAGAAGVAVQGAIMRAPDPAEAAATLTTAWAEARAGQSCAETPQPSTGTTAAALVDRASEATK
ncbi:thiamine phosphate synthase [Micromonospora haikouensis]|uniref:thiamine phosphate synthase n=1 Tax=Micromonospora haikouensis TaxID=686309 RepID=UPI003F4D0B28